MKRQLIRLGLLVGGLVLLGLLIAGGWTIKELYDYATFPDTVPTIGPLSSGSGGPGGPSSNLTVSQNCLEIGETVVFTATLANESAYPSTIEGTPPIDIVVRPASWSHPTAPPEWRWSATKQYPHDLNPTFQPGERRSYTWTWVVDPALTTTGMRVDLERGAFVDSPAGITHSVYPGLGGMQDQYQRGFTCAEMRSGRRLR